MKFIRSNADHFGPFRTISDIPEPFFYDPGPVAEPNGDLGFCKNVTKCHALVTRYMKSAIYTIQIVSGWLINRREEYFDSFLYTEIVRRSLAERKCQLPLVPIPKDPASRILLSAK